MKSLNIDKLRFFLGSGQQINMLKQYSVKWEIIPNDSISYAFLKNPTGHFECGLSTNITDDVFNFYNPNFIVDNTTLINSDTKYMLSEYIEYKDFYLYSITVPKNSEILFYKKVNKKKVQGEKIIQILSDDTYKLAKHISSEEEQEYTHFRIKAVYSEDFSYDIREQYACANIIVDDPGHIQKHASFVRKSISETGYDFLHNPAELYTVYPDTDISQEITNKTNSSIRLALNNFKKVTYQSKEEILDDIFKIIFFHYEYKVDKNAEVRHIENYIKISLISETNEIIESEYPLRDFFSSTAELCNEDNLHKFICNNPDDNEILNLSDNLETDYYIYGVKSELFTSVLVDDDRTDFDDVEKEIAGSQTSSFYLINNNLTENSFPYIKYIGNVYQEPVSTDFIAADSIIIVQEDEEETVDNVTRYRYSYPDIIDNNNPNSRFKLHLKFQNNSELFFVTSSDNVNLNRLQQLYLKTKTEIYQESTPENQEQLCANFTVGFQSSEEGCYKNVMGIFARDLDTDYEYFVASIIFYTEVEGEDERFRTLFTNFGIPDPIKYPNIFKEQDPKEEGADWTFLNNKSKELFLCYDEIFPYVGTYKALFNAIKFLGYQDIVFKEWYSIKDTNDKDKLVAFQNYDTATCKSIQNMLKHYGISFEDYERYTKLNRLSLIYHLQKIEEEEKEDELKIYKNGINIGERQFEIPAISNVYEYRSDEVLLKLYAVKQWLEKYITGVNCYISDINAEGIVLERFKTIGYVTEHEFKDITQEGYFTPRCYVKKDENKKDIVFKDSSSAIICTLNEFNSITFDDYKDYTISDFIHQRKVINVNINNVKKDMTIYDSAPFCALTVADDYQFTLKLNNAVSGTLYEFADKSSITNPIYVNDGEIMFWDQKKNISKIDKKKLPVIQITKGNIRKCSGDWMNTIDKNNIIWKIYNTADENGQYYCHMINKNNEEIRTKSFINLSPDFTFDNKNNVITDAEFFYTSENNWQVPMFFIKGYKVTNQFITDKFSGKSNQYVDDFYEANKKEEYIIEIIEGSIKFTNVDKEQDKHCSAAEITFAEQSMEEAGSGEQIININYEYNGKREHIYEFKLDNKSNKFSTLNDFYNYLDLCMNLNTEIEIPVNRLGNYSVLVKAYDSYNNTYVNKSDDLCKICADKPSIEMYMNVSSLTNSDDFYRDKLVVDGSLIDNDYVSSIIDKMEERPVFPINYKILNASHWENKYDTNNYVTYDSLSYAIDTPKANDYIVFTNMTESAEIASTPVLTSDNLYGLNNVGSSTIGKKKRRKKSKDKDTENVLLSAPVDNLKMSLKLKSSNPGKQDVTTIGNHLNLCVYDDNLQKMIYETNVGVVCRNYTKSNNNNQNTHISDNGTIEVEFLDKAEAEVFCNASTFNNCVSTNTLLKDLVNNDNNINLYIIDKKELYIDVDTPVRNKSTRTGLKQAFIPCSSNDLKRFNKDTVVKFRAFVNNTSDYRHKISETAFRIIDNNASININKNKSADASALYIYGYVVDGNIDTSYIRHLPNSNILNKNENVEYEDSSSNISHRYDRDDVSFVIKPLHEKAVKYYVRVDADAAERTQLYEQEGNFYNILTSVKYNPQQLLFNSYFDDSYAFNVMKFDPLSLDEIWNNKAKSDLCDDNDIIDTSIYSYVDTPITINNNDYIIVKTEDDFKQFENSNVQNGRESKIIWKWYSYLLEDRKNWKNHTASVDKICLFESINDILTVRPKIVGSQSIELYCIDKYGNMIKNTGGGNLYVNNTEDITNYFLEKDRERLSADVPYIRKSAK